MATTQPTTCLESSGVIAVESDSTLVARPRERFVEPIRDGLLELVNAASGSKEELGQLWIWD
jgi:hypothetical protein